MSNYTTIKLRDYQSDGIDQIARNFSMGHRRQLFQLPTGAGKCHGKGTKILLHNGAIKPVEEIHVGDQLMGPDGLPRNVLSLARGREMMYEVIPVKGESYVCNESHILSVVHIESMQVHNIPLKKLYKFSDFKVFFAGWKVEGVFNGDLTKIISPISEIKRLQVDDYYGFELDGDHLYLLGDFTVTHNTVTFAGLIQRYLQKYSKSIIVCVHREELLEQTRKTLYNGFGIHSEAIVAGKKHIPQSRVYVAMVETVNNMLKNRPLWAQHIGCAIVDECHIANFNKLYDYFEKALIIGFTATPIAASKKDPLKNYFDEIVVGPQIEELIQMGSLCENITYGIKGIDTKKFGIKRGEFDNEVMGNEFSKSKNVKNCVDKYAEKGEGKKAIVFNCNITHSKLVTQAFIDAGYNAKHLDGTEPKEQRKKIFEWFANEDDAILCNIAVATTGFDEPSIRNVIVNRSTMSLPLWLQMCGRGSRPFPGKDYFNIIDLGANTKLHLDWRSYRNWHYIFHNPQAPNDGNGIAPIKNCEKCEAIIPAQSVFCKYCGHEHIREINYDQINIELEMIIGRINVEAKHKENTEKGHKDFKTFFDILNTTFTIIKNHGDQLPNDLFRENQHNKFQEKVKEWCKLAGKPYGTWMKSFAKEQFDKKYLENKKLYA